MKKLCMFCTRRTSAMLLAILFCVTLSTIALTAPLSEENNQLVVRKVVVDDETELDIKDWLEGKGYDPEAISLILADISFELFVSDKDGNKLGEVPVGTVGISADGTIRFPSGIPSGWYLMREKLGSVAGAVFQDGISDVLVEYDVGLEITADTYFTVTQYKDQSRPLRALYRDADGNENSLYTSPWLEVDPPVPGGGALGTSRFEATQDNGEKFMSFCADIGAYQCEGKYVIDDTDHSFTSTEMLRLVAALDFIYTRSGFTDYEDIALAQLVVWNLILEYTDIPMTADLWLKELGVKFTEVWGKLYKIEGMSELNGVEYWYVQAHRDLIDDILEHAYDDTYVDIYKERMAGGATRFVSAAYFLIGTGEYPAHLQQGQLMITYGSTAIISNIPATPTPTPPPTPTPTPTPPPTPTPTPTPPPTPTPTPTPPPTPTPERGRMEIEKAFSIADPSDVPDTWSATITVTGPNNYSSVHTITGANRVVTLTDLEPGQYTVEETTRDNITNYTFVDVTGEGSYTVSGAGTTSAAITNAYITITPTPTPTLTPTPTPTLPPGPTPTPTSTPAPTPTPTPPTGSLTVTKAFNIEGVPSAWSATITVTGPNNYSSVHTITGANRVVTLTGLALGQYTVTETDPVGITNYTLYNVTGEGAYTVSGGPATTATITNFYDTEIDDDDVPTTETPPIDITDPPPPTGELPKTSVADKMLLYDYGLGISLVIIGTVCYALWYSKRTIREKK